MATSRISFKQRLYTDLRGSSALLTLLGPVSAANYRIYSAWPPQQPALSGHEPAEGWLVFLDNATPISLYEDHHVQVHCWATRDSLNEQVVGLLDALWHKSDSDQDGWTITGDWVVTRSRRVNAIDLYEVEVHLYHKATQWLFRTQKVPYRTTE